MKISIKKMGNREIAAVWKSGVWASRVWWHNQKLEHLCETEDRIACIALSVPPLDLEVPPPATACCGPIWIFWGGVLHMRDSLRLRACLSNCHQVCHVLACLQPQQMQHDCNTTATQLQHDCNTTATRHRHHLSSCEMTVDGMQHITHLQHTNTNNTTSVFGHVRATSALSQMLAQWQENENGKCKHLHTWYTYICIYACVYICILYMWTYTLLCVCVHACMCVHMYINHTFTFIYIPPR